MLPLLKQNPPNKTTQGTTLHVLSSNIQPCVLLIVMNHELSVCSMGRDGVDRDGVGANVAVFPSDSGRGLSMAKLNAHLTRAKTGTKSQFIHVLSA
jgi:hypothetical protein